MNTALITGAGSGIGAAAAKKLSEREGMRLLLMGRRLEPLLEVKRSLHNSERHEAVSMDVSDARGLVSWLSGEVANLTNHPLVAVFANAGIGGPNVFGEDDRWDDIIRINLTGTYNTLMACHPYLKRSDGVTHALVTSSVLARFGVPGQTAYVASKTGLLGLVRSLALEWSPDGVMVNALCPGWVDTEMARDSIQAMADAESMGQLFVSCGVDSLIIDTGVRPERKLKDLADLMRAPYFPMPRADAKRLSQTIEAAV